MYSRLMAILDRLKHGLPPALDFLIDNLRLRWSEVYITSPVTTTITDTTSYFDVAGEWTIGHTRGFDSPSNGVIRYQGTDTALAFVFATLSLSSVNPNEDVHLRVERNGADVPGSDAQTLIGTDIEELVAFGLLVLEPGDLLTVALRNESGADDLTAREGHVLVMAASE